MSWEYVGAICSSGKGSQGRIPGVGVVEALLTDFVHSSLALALNLNFQGAVSTREALSEDKETSSRR